MDPPPLPASEVLIDDVVSPLRTLPTETEESRQVATVSESEPDPPPLPTTEVLIDVVVSPLKTLPTESEESQVATVSESAPELNTPVMSPFQINPNITFEAVRGVTFESQEELERFTENRQEQVMRRDSNETRSGAEATVTATGNLSVQHSIFGNLFNLIIEVPNSKKKN